MQYTIQVNQPGRGKMDTDIISSNKKRVYDRVREVTQRGQQCRVFDSTGHILDPDEVHELR